MKKQFIIQNIYNSFPKQEPPPSHSISLDWNTSEPSDGRDLYLSLKGKGWWELQPELVLRLVRQCGLFSFIRAPYFAYILPAILLAIVELGDESDVILDNFFGIASDYTVVFCREEITFDFIAIQCNQIQKDTVLKFLEYCLTMWPDDCEVKLSVELFRAKFPGGDNKNMFKNPHPG